MRLYIYYNTNDSTKESHGKIEATNFIEATKTAAKRKQLSVSEFLKIFTVEEYERK